MEATAPLEIKQLKPSQEAEPSLEAQPSAEKKNEPSSVRTPYAEEKLSLVPSSQIARPSFRCVLGVPDPNGNVLFMVLVSVFYALLTPWPLCGLAGEPTAFVWTTSLLASSYFFVGTICLSRRTMRFWSAFFRTKPIIALLLVAAAHYFIRPPNSGAAVATLLTLYTAGVFGYAIAEYLQCVGSEESVNVVLAPESLAREREKGLEESKYYFLFTNSVMSLFVLVRIAWLVLHSASAVRLISDSYDNVNEATFIVKEISLETLLVVWQWSAFVALCLQEEAIVSMSTMVRKVLASVIVLCALSAVVSIAVGEVAEVLILWLVAMAVVALFGYIVSMFGRYYEILIRNRRLPAWVDDLSKDGPNEHDQSLKHGRNQYSC